MENKDPWCLVGARFIAPSAGRDKSRPYIINVVGARFTASSCLIIICLLLAACDSNPAPVAPTTTLAPTATIVVMLPITSSAAPCPPVAPPPTLTPAPIPTDYVPGTPQASLPIATLHIFAACRTVTLRVQIASTAAQQEQGLMGRTDMAQDEGMLFDFGTDNAGDTFWMKNTPTPLSIAFISANLHIGTLDEMAAFDDKNFHASTSPYRYAVEANAGFFTRYGVKVGDRVEIIRQ